MYTVLGGEFFVYRKRQIRGGNYIMIFYTEPVSFSRILSNIFFSILET